MSFLVMISCCPQVTTAVLVFSNLGTLNEELTLVLDKSLSYLSAAILEALDVQTLTQASAPTDASKSRGM